MYKFIILKPGGPTPGSIRGGHRDLETEELIEDQQQRIRELERTNGNLKDKLLGMVFKQASEFSVCLLKPDLVMKNFHELQT